MSTYAAILVLQFFVFINGMFSFFPKQDLTWNHNVKIDSSRGVLVESVDIQDSSNLTFLLLCSIPLKTQFENCTLTKVKHCMSPNASQCPMSSTLNALHLCRSKFYLHSRPSQLSLLHEHFPGFVRHDSFLL